MYYFAAMKFQFLIAADHTGAGKTTVTLGLLRAMQQKGYRVQPFKCGPDYIDPIHHRAAAGCDSINLDLFMMSNGHLRMLYQEYGNAADVCITEGVMGLFDGARKMEGSSAEIAVLLGLPVLLVLNARTMAYSAAAILYGMKHFDPRIQIAGVLFNFVDTASHYRFLQEACEDVGVTSLGYLPANEDVRISSRHLGLDTADAEDAIRAAAGHMEKYVDWDVLKRVTAVEENQRVIPSADQVSAMVTNDRLSRRADRKILVARDAAFLFTYTENIRRLEEWGTVHYFSPVQDDHLPVTAGLIYLPGGYPELYLQQLAGNRKMQDLIRAHYASGGKILAECGGMMYLGRSITDEVGKTYPMTGILNLTTSIHRKELHMGYRTIRLDGYTVKGHEFHYSRMVDSAQNEAVCDVFNARGELVASPVFHTSDLLASYMHFYWGENGDLLENWLD
jgi:cobyrinic acid a,c-diamide synthase